MASAAFFFLTVNPLQAQLSQFGGPHRNGVYEEVDLMDSWPEGGPRLLATLNGLGEGFAAPTVTDEGMYIAGMIDTMGHVFHLGHDHRLKWKVAVGEEFSFKYVGSRASPTIEGERLYYVASMGDAVCLNATTGKEIWKMNLMDRFNGPKIKWGYTESPLIYQDKIFFTPGGSGANVVALDKLTGDVIWAAHIDSTVNAYCSPLLIQHGGQDFVALNTRDYLLMMDPADGRVLVRHPIFESHVNHAQAPLYAEGHFFYSSGYGEGSTLFKIREGSELLDTVYVNKDLDVKISGMILYEGTVFGTADKLKRWVGVDLKSGQTVFTSREFKPGSFILADDKFYLYSEKGEVALAHPSPQGFEIRSRFQLPVENAAYAFAHPVIRDGILYIRYQDRLFLYQVR